ncbi:FAD-dependent oxidoreductase [Candidatus Woesearchaeota archaeon]|nr:FAD-dependent oxidoreductase [Candidatus Woesearchaeota archaeon]
MKVIIIGSGASGLTCASELRKNDKKIDITILSKNSELPYSPCSLPYVVSKETTFEKITTFDLSFFENNKIKLLLNSDVESINRDKKEVYFMSENKGHRLKYDFLVIASGSNSYVPNIKGLNEIKFNKFYTKTDASQIINETKKAKQFVIIGGGLIGIELGTSLLKLKKDVTIVEGYKTILSSILDDDFSKKVEESLTNNGLKIITDAKIESVNKKEIILQNSKIPYDSLIVSCGSIKNKQIAEIANIQYENGITVDDELRTNDKYIFACGDCAQIKNHALLATNAIKQGKIVALNILGNTKKIDESVNTTCTKIGGLHIASCGLTKKQLVENKIDVIEGKYTGKLCSSCMNSEEDISVKVLSDKNLKILGAQIIGNSNVVGRINWITLAIKKGITIDEFMDIETAYNPAVSQLYDPVKITCEIILRKLQRKK